MSQRENNREKYPSVAELIDKVREKFPDAKVTGIRHMEPGEWAERMHKLRTARQVTDAKIRVGAPLASLSPKIMAERADQL